MGSITNLSISYSKVKNIIIVNDFKLNGWTKVPATGGVTISSTFGNPSPAIQATVGGSYAYINANAIIPYFTTFWGKTINIDMYCTDGNLVDFFFACNSSGAGRMFRLDVRGSQSGITTTTNWNTWLSPTAVANLLPNTWYNFVITITTTGNATFKYKTQASGTYTNYATNVAIPNSQTFIGIQADGLGGGYIDNLDISNTKILISDGTSIASWTKVPATGGVIIGTVIGNPKNSIQATVTLAYAYLNATTLVPGLTTFWGRIINVDMYCTNGNLIDFFFACNVSGAGNMFRLEVREYETGITTTDSWTTWGNPIGISGLLASTWYNIIITITSSGTATFKYKTQASGTYTNCGTVYNISNSGTYIGIQADGLGGGYIDNIYIT